MSPEAIVLIVSAVMPILLVVTTAIIKHIESGDAAKEAKWKAEQEEQDSNLKEATEWRLKFLAEKEARMLAEIEVKSVQAELERTQAELETYKNRYQKGA